MDVPFDVLMKQAVDLKTAQLAEDRRKYDSWKLWYRNSLFARMDVIEIRKNPDFQAKVAFVNDCRKRGNEGFRQEDYISATIEYERALSVWDWVESVLEDWKHNAIQDKDLSQKSYFSKDDTEAEMIKESKVANLLNLALCYQRIGQFADSIAACDEILEHYDINNVKALYRRAQARIIPKNTGMTEHLIALKDLKRALDLSAPASASSVSKTSKENSKQEDQNYQAILRTYQQLRKDLFLMKQFEKKHFHNLFQKIQHLPVDTATDGTTTTITHQESSTAIHSTTYLSPTQVAGGLSAEEWEVLHPVFSSSEEELEVLLEEIQSKIDDYVRKEEDEKFIEQLKEKQSAVRQLIDYRRNEKEKEKTKKSAIDSLDFLHPTQEMIEEAKQFDLDLNNPAHRELLHEIKTTDHSNPDITKQEKTNHRVAETPMNKKVERALHRLYEKESKDLAGIALKGCSHETLRNMMLTRLDNYRILSASTSHAANFSSSPSSPSRFTFDRNDIIKWTEQKLYEKLEEEMILDLILTYEKFHSTSQDQSSGETLKEDERKEWAEAVMQTMQLYYERNSMAVNNFPWFGPLWQQFISYCQSFFFIAKDKDNSLATRYFGGSFGQTMIIILFVLISRIILQFIVFPLFSSSPSL